MQANRFRTADPELRPSTIRRIVRSSKSRSSRLGTAPRRQPSTRFAIFESCEQRQLLAGDTQALDPTPPDAHDAQEQHAQVIGLKWEDLNGNGSRDPGEPGLAGVTVFSDRNNNGLWDQDEPRAITMRDNPATDRDETGRYELGGLEPGRHTIREVVPDGFAQTFPGSTAELANGRAERVDRSDAFDVALTSAQIGTTHPDGTSDVQLTFRISWGTVCSSLLPELTTFKVDGNTISVELFGRTHSEICILVVPEPEIHTVNFTSLAPGTYQIGAILQESAPMLPAFWTTWRLSATLGVHSGGAHTVQLAAGDVLGGINFGNQPQRQPSVARGTVWLDADGNGQRDRGELGLAAVTIYADVNANGVWDADEPHIRTARDNPATPIDETGQYALLDPPPGLYAIREVVPPGFAQTFPSAADGGGHALKVEPGRVYENINFGNQPTGETGSLHGRKWVDNNGNGRPDRDEPGLAGVVIYVDTNWNDAFDRGEPAVRTMPDDPDTKTDETGMYWFNEVTPGFYLVREVVPDGYEQTFPEVLQCDAIFCNGRAHMVTVEAGQTIDGLDFGNQPVVATGSLRGIKWSDNNGNGQRDRTEPGLPGVTIYLDLNGNARLDDGEPRTITMADNPNTREDERGQYAFTNMEPGFYVIREVVPEGYKPTFPPDLLACPAVVCSGPAHRVTVEAGQTIAGLDFGNQPEVVTEKGSLRGMKWSDENGNGQRDRGEPGLAGVTIYLDTNLNNQFDEGDLHTVTMNDDPSTPEDETGLYWFRDVEPGFYLVREVVPHGYEPTFPPVLTCRAVFCNGRAHMVTVESGQTVDGLDFGNQPSGGTGSIQGVKWLDRDGNGKRGDDEPGLGGVTVYVDLNGNGLLDRGEPSAVTSEDNPVTDFDEGGQYVIDGLRPARYVVREVVPDGFVQTSPPVDPGVPREDVRPAHDAEDPDRFVTVRPDIIRASLAAGEVLETTVSMTIHPVCITFEEITVAASDPDIPFQNRSGVQINGCGGDTSSFDVAITGDGRRHEFQLQFVDAADGHVFAHIPVLIAPRQKPLPGAHIVVVEAGQAVQGIDFGNRRIEATGSIRGVKWNDLNGNGRRDRDEPGLAGVIIYVDTNHNGQRDDSEPHTQTRSDDPATRADETGQYQLEGLAAGEHVVREVVPERFTQTFPKGGAGIRDSRSFEVAPGASLRFGLTDATVTSTQEGQAALDLTVTSVWPDSCGQLLEDRASHVVLGQNIFVQLFGQHVGQACAEVITERTQTIRVAGLEAPRPYFVFAALNERLDESEIFFPTRAVQATVAMGRGDHHVVNLRPGQSVEGINFGNQRIQIAHPVLGDSNDDGRFDSSDLTHVFQAGKYRTGQPADFSEGDWNGDGLFDEADLIAVFKEGGYENNAQAAAAVELVAGQMAAADVVAARTSLPVRRMAARAGATEPEQTDPSRSLLPHRIDLPSLAPLRPRQLIQRIATADVRPLAADAALVELSDEPSWRIPSLQQVLD